MIFRQVSEWAGLDSHGTSISFLIQRCSWIGIYNSHEHYKFMLPQYYNIIVGVKLKV